MKKSKFVLLSLISLALVGCNPANPSSVAPDSEPPINENSDNGKTSSAPASSQPTSSAPAESSDTPVSSVTGDESGSSSEESVSSSVDPYSIGWSRDITDKMIRYLGGYVIPYVNLGKSKSVYSDYTVSDTDTGVLTISSITDWDATWPTKLSAIFTGSEWTIGTNSSSQFKATNATAKVTVVAKADESGSVCLYLTYDEPYDVNAASDWPDDVKTEFTTDLGDIPAFVYLGTANPVASKRYSSDEYVTVTGGKWDDQVLSDAETDLSAAGYTVTKTTDSLSAKGKATNGKDQFRIEISSYTGYSTGAIKKIRAKVYLEEAFDPTGATAWPTDVATDISTNLDGHDLPFVYLGTKTPTSYWSTYSKKLEITGGNWDDQVLDLAATAYPISDTCVVTRDDTAKTFKAVVTETDGCVLTIEIGKTYGGKAEMDISISKAFVVPSGADWSTATKSDMTTNFKGHVIPYIYLNTTSETSSWSSTSSTLTITGGDWDNAIVTNAKSVLDADTAKGDTDTTKVATWTVTTDSDGSRSTLSATGSLTDGSIFSLSLSADLDYYTYDYVAELKVQYKPKYEVPATATDWDTDTLTAFSTYLHGHKIPYVYLNTLTPTTQYYTSSKELDVKGSTFDAEMLTEAKKNYLSAGWTDAKINPDGSTYSDSFTASHTFDADGEDGCTVSLKMYGNYYGNVLMEFTLTEGFRPDTHTDWTDATKTTMTTAFGETLPFVYLGTVSESASSSNNNYVTINGGAWDDSIITSAKTTYEAAGYTCFEGTGYYGKTLSAYKTDDTTFKTYVVTIEKSSNGSPKMTIYSDTGAAIPATATAWDSTITTAFNTYTGNTTTVLPYLYLGTGTPSSSTSSYSNTFTVTTPSGSNYYITKAYETLKADGTGSDAWSFTVIPATYGMDVTALKVYTDGGKLSLKISKTYSGNVELVAKYTPPFKSSATDWSDDVKTAIKAKCNDHLIPYFYMGSDTPTITNYTNEVDLNGSTWDDLIYTNAINAFSNEKDADGKSYWTWIWDYSSSTTRLVASRAFDDGSHFTVKIYKNSSDLPLVEIYYR